MYNYLIRPPIIIIIIIITICGEPEVARVAVSWQYVNVDQNNGRVNFEVAAAQAAVAPNANSSQVFEYPMRMGIDWSWVKACRTSCTWPTLAQLTLLESDPLSRTSNGYLSLEANQIHFNETWRLLCFNHKCIDNQSINKSQKWNFCLTIFHDIFDSSSSARQFVSSPRATCSFSSVLNVTDRILYWFDYYVYLIFTDTWRYWPLAINAP